MTPKKEKGTAKEPPRKSQESADQGLDDARTAGVEEPFPIVGIGASAGGLETYTQLLQKLPADTGMAFVLVQHLDPKHASILTELLSRTSRMPVREVEDNMPVEPNRVYVIPPNTDMGILHGVLHLMPRSEVRGQHMPVDYFLQSLAQDQGSKAIGVILSGTASDGAGGLGVVKSEGGITFAQDPATAKYDGMPRAAIAADAVDFVLSPEAIAFELARIGRHPFVARAQAGEHLPEAEASDVLGKVFILLRSATGVDFTYYKHSTIRRRITRRMVLHKIESLADYVQHIQEHPTELAALYEDILITVTRFFREAETFEALKGAVFSKITRRKGPEVPFRVWVTGCSTGEEAYSLAIALIEFFDQRPIRPPVQIFATDIDEKALEKARQGIYPSSITADVSPERLRRFFVQVEGGYQVNKLVREMCVFARHDVTKDPPFSKMDLISCRNLLIYLGPVLQKRVVPLFHYALSTPGFLLLGATETIGRFANLFQLEEKKHKIYSRKAAVARLPAGFAPAEYVPERPVGRKIEPKASVPAALDPLAEADRLVLAEHAPAGVVVNEDLEVLQFRGDTSPYLRLAPGRPTLNLLRMAREQLTLELRTLFHKAKRSHTPGVKEGLRLQHNQEYRDFNVRVRPMCSPTGEWHYLVLFEDVERGASPAKEAGRAKPRKTDQADLSGVAELEKELSETREYLQTMIEEKDASNEELRAANEEIQSSNEELQSINEELETAKEELQSSNEELTTVNEELQNRNVEVIQTNDDLTNLLSSTNLPTVMLGPDLRIRRLTSIAEKTLNLIPTDIGRPIRDIRLGIEIADLERSLLEVIDTVTPREQEVQDEKGRWFSVRIRPYKTSENKIDGAVITLVDIDSLKRTEEHRRLATVVRDSNDAITLQDFDGKILAWNRGAEVMYGYSEAEALAMDVTTIIPPEQREGARALAERLVRAEVVDSFETQRVSKRGDVLDVWVTATLLLEDDGRPSAVATTERDITARKKTEEYRRSATLVRDSNDAITVQDFDGKILAWNRAAEAMYGYSEAEAVGMSISTIIPAELRKQGQALNRKLMRGESVEFFETQRVRKSGDRLDVSVTASALLDDEGKPIAIATTERDITERERARKALERSEQQFREMLEKVKLISVILDAKGNIIFCNDYLLDLTGWRLEEIAGKSWFELFLPSELRSGVGSVFQELLDRETPAHYENEILTRSGERRLISFNNTVLRDVNGNPTGTASIGEDITELRRASEFDRALAEIDGLAHSSLEPGPILQRIVADSAKALGVEAAAALLREEDGWVVKGSFGAAESSVGRRLTEAEARAMVGPLTSRRPVVVNDITRDDRFDPKLAEPYGIRSVLIVPLLVKDRIIGAIAYTYHSTPVPFSEAQVDFSQRLARTLSLALENASLYADQRTIADTLQEALLTVPAQIDGVDFGYFYSSATEAALVGGDFYDIFEREHGRVGIVIGDVSGKGVEAASVASLVKNTIRAYSYEVDSPAAIMAKTSEAVRKTTDPGIFVTVFFGVLDLASGKLTYCCAGHPPPILKSKTKRQRLLRCGCPALGMAEDLAFGNRTANISEGDIVILYTDGVTEARGLDGFYGEKRLLELVKGLEESSVRRAPGMIFEEVNGFTGGKLTDDVALLAVSLAR